MVPMQHPASLPGQQSLVQVFRTGIPLPCIPGMNLIALASLSISIPLVSRTLGGSWERFCSSPMLSPHVRTGTVATMDGTWDRVEV